MHRLRRPAGAASDQRGRARLGRSRGASLAFGATTIVSRLQCVGPMAAGIVESRKSPPAVPHAAWQQLAREPPSLLLDIVPIGHSLKPCARPLRRSAREQASALGCLRRLTGRLALVKCCQTSLQSIAAATGRLAHGGVTSGRQRRRRRRRSLDTQLRSPRPWQR